MNEYRARIELASPLLAPSVEAAWQADTVFGHVCWASVRRLGEQRLARFLAACRAGEPALIVSNGYPSGLLPRPLWTLPERRDTRKEAALAAMARAKRAGQHGLVPLADFERLRAGQRADGGSKRGAIWNGLPRQHSTVSRAGGVADEGGLYALPESWTPEVTVYARADAVGYEALVAFAEHLETEGYGKRRSAGYGAVRRAVIEPFAGFLPLDGTNGFVSLSNFIPAQADPTEGRWRVLTKRGKLGDEWAVGRNPFKRPLLFLEAGSCFLTSTPRPWYGRMIDGVAPGRPEVVQYALAYAVPMRLPEEREQ
jgi:CRISPR-associated protein Csm4